MERYGMNRTSAIEWLNKSWHHFSSGKVLYEAKHYTDVIAIMVIKNNYKNKWEEKNKIRKALKTSKKGK